MILFFSVALQRTPLPVVEHHSLGTSGASALRAQFDCNLTAIWFKFDVRGQETEAPELSLEFNVPVCRKSCLIFLVSIRLYFLNIDAEVP